jgi:hypothetical protein
MAMLLSSILQKENNLTTATHVQACSKLKTAKIDPNVFPVSVGAHG